MARTLPCLVTVFFVLFAIPLVPASSAQDTAPGSDARTITFNEAIQLALENNAGLRQARNEIDGRSSAVTQRRSDFLPNLTASFSGSQRFGTTFDTNVGGFVDESTLVASASLSSSVNVFDGFGNIARLRTAQINLEQSELDLQRTEQDVIFEVMSQYLDIILSKENVRIQEENLQSQKQQLEQTEEFVRVGMQPQSDLFQQEAQVASAELALLQAERQFQVNQVQLIRTLQLDPFEMYEFDVITIEEDDLSIEQYALDTLMQQAFDRRPDLQSEERSIASSEQGIREARSGYFPSVSLNASSSGSFTDQLDGFSFADQVFDARRTESIGLQVSIPIFDRLQTRNQVQQARVQRENARLSYEDQRQNIAVQVREAYLDLMSAEKELDVTRAQERAAERALEATQERYNLGAATLVELTQAQSEFVDASSNRVQARYEYVFQQRLIDYYVGILDPTQPLFD